MGFKRTSEGRVFFQKSEQTANDHLRRQKPELSGGNSSERSEILAVLKALNERLKTSQTERRELRRELNVYRSLIEDLEDKAERSERAYINLEEKMVLKQKTATTRAQSAEKLAQDTMKELAETRKLLIELEDKTDIGAKSLSAIKKVQTEQEQKLAGHSAAYTKLTKRVQDAELKQEDLGGKLDETVSKQDRLIRQVDKAIEDRTRFLRKIERIEETVLQTRDALNAKAMVLLTDQGVASDGALVEESLLDDEEGMSYPGLGRRQVLPAPEQERWNRALWVFLIAGLIVAAVLGGWFARELQREPANVENSEAFIIEESSLSDGSSQTEPLPHVSTGRPENSFADDNTPVTGSESSVFPVYDVPDDIGTIDLNDEAKLLQLLEENPDLVAAQLNAVEPGPVARTDEVRRESEVKARREPVSEVGREELVVSKAPPSNTSVAVTPVPEQDFAAPDPNLPEAVREVEAQALQGVAEAQHDLAAIYTAGHAGVKQDYTRAAFWFRKAAEQAVSNAAYNLGVLHHQGLGMPADIDEAVLWYERAAALGHPEAQYNLGIAYIEGVGVTYDPQKASGYFKQAARSGVMEAAYNLGLIYENALLGKAEPDQALMWYKAAADQGSPEAKAALEQLAKTLNMDIGEVNALVEDLKKNQEESITKTAPQKKR